MTSTAPKILIATFGSLGDLHPFVALAHALKRDGFRPIVAASAAYADHVAGEGLEFAPIRPDAADLTARLGIDMGEIARRMAQDDAFLFKDLIFPHLRESYDDLVAASDGAVAIVAHSLAFSARVAAEALRLPLVTVLLSPMKLYSAYDPPIGSRAPLRPWPATASAVRFNRFLLWGLSHAIALSARPLWRLRRDLGLPPRYGLDLLLGGKVSVATIGLFSSALAPPQPDHAPNLLIAGHTFHDRFPGAESLAPELAAFLDQGEAPIVFTLGSFVARARNDHYRAFVAAARAVGKRAVLLAHEDDVAALRQGLPADAHVASYTPHSLIFPKACAVIHHGGIGTTGQALRAGRPQIVMPFLGDQPDNAGRLRRLGVAREIDGETMTMETLARELELLFKDGRYAARAETLAASVRQEDGAGVAARRIAAIAGGAA